MNTIERNGWYINVDYGLGALTSDQVESNGFMLARGLYFFGWTKECIAGILGNTNAESGNNPGSTENPKPWNTLPSNQEVLQSSYLLGMGLTQWTPGRDKIVQFAEDNNLLWYDGQTQIYRLKWECDNGEQMGGWQWYINSHGDPADLAEYFLRQYERPSEEQIEQTLPIRRRYASEWYDKIKNVLLDIPLMLMISKQEKELKKSWQEV